VEETTRQETAPCAECGRDTTHVVHERRDEDGSVAFEWRDCYEGGHAMTPAN
jgi:hypothetical protein